MRSWWVRGLGLAVLSLVALTGHPAQSGPDARSGGKSGKSGKSASQELACRADADCVLVTDGCCGCHEAGKQRAIPARARAAYERKRKALCRKTLCPALMSEDPSCLSGKAVCKEGTCALGS